MAAVLGCVAPASDTNCSWCRAETRALARSREVDRLIWLSDLDRSRYAGEVTFIADCLGCPYGGRGTDIAALAIFLTVAAPTAAQTAAATKALIRVLANYAEVVPAQRATMNVLADTIRFMLQR